MKVKEVWEKNKKKFERKINILVNIWKSFVSLRF